MEMDNSSDKSGDTSPLISEKSTDSENFEELIDELELPNARNEYSRVAGDIYVNKKTEDLAEDIDNNLPETVTLLTNEHGSKVYLVGTAHFSVQSQHDVAKIIKAVQPNIVVVELCTSRLNILHLDEETLLREAKSINMEKIMSTIKQNGAMQGLMYILLLNMSAHITKELGMAPGGEFRTAFREAAKVPNCTVHLGDRPISITLKRALCSLSWWQTITLAWHLLTSKDPISKEDVEKCKNKDLLEELISEMAGEFPALGEVFVNERDIFLAHSLQYASLQRKNPDGSLQAVKVVGVVGIGHVPGITRLWPTKQYDHVARVLVIPPPSLSSRVIKLSFKLALVGTVGYLGYNFIPGMSRLKDFVVGQLRRLR